MKVTKEQRSYRPKACTVKLIEVLGEKLGMKSQADVIDMWADAWVEKNGAPSGFGEWQWSEKKLGAAREEVAEDIPDEVLAKPVKVGRAVVLPAVIKGSELPEPKKKVSAMGEDGRIYINGVAQVRDLAAERAARANAGPMLRPGQK